MSNDATPPVAGTVQISPPETNAISFRSGESEGSVKYARASASATLGSRTVSTTISIHLDMSGPPIRIRLKSLFSIRAIRGYEPESAHRKRTELSHLHRHSKELETVIRQLAKSAEVLDDR